MGTRINVRNAAYALVSKNTKTEYAIGSKVLLPELRSIELSASLSTGSLYGDGSKVEDTAKLTGVTCNIAINKLSIEARAALQGSEIVGGVMTVKDTDVAPEVALYFETEETDGNKEQIWLLVGKAQPISLNGTQKEDNITYSTDSLVIGCVPRKKDGVFFKMGDTELDTFSSTISTAFAADPDQ